MTPSLSIAAAALLTEVLYAGIIALGIYKHDVNDFLAGRHDLPKATLYGCVVAMLFASVLLIALTRELSTQARPAFGNYPLPEWPLPQALAVVFIINIVVSAIATSGTGGVFNSPLAPSLTILPALAIFLRQPLASIAFQVVIISVIFTVSLHTREPTFGGSYGSRNAELWVTVASLVLTTFVGYVTRPS